MAIEHVVIIVKENHAFDNYFGSFPNANGERLNQAQNPPPDDPFHDHRTWMRRASDPRYHVQYTQNDIPRYFDYAKKYTLCDNYFTEVGGPSTPNHLMLICADAPIINNPAHHYNPKPGQAYQLNSLPEQLDNKGLTWGNYGGYAFHFINKLAGHAGNHTRDLFLHDASGGRLPSVSWVYGDGRPDLSEHPKQNVTDGMNLTVDLVDAVVKGGLWDKIAIFITWDDWGGWYDHVDPPVVEKWDSARAQRPADAFPEFNGDPFRYGSRVGCLVLSPYAKAGHVSHQLNSHVSLVRFCQKTFNLPPLNDRDGKSNGMSDCFDFNQRPLAPPN
jgi:phospholipase C